MCVIRKRFISHASLSCANLNFIQFSSIKYYYSSQRSKCVSRIVTCVALCSQRDEKSRFTFSRAIRHVRNVLETPIESRACGETRNPTRERTFLGERNPERVVSGVAGSPRVTLYIVPLRALRREGQRGGWFSRSSGPETNYPSRCGSYRGNIGKFARTAPSSGSHSFPEQRLEGRFLTKVTHE